MSTESTTEASMPSSQVNFQPTPEVKKNWVRGAMLGNLAPQVLVLLILCATVAGVAGFASLTTWVSASEKETYGMAALLFAPGIIPLAALFFFSDRKGDALFNSAFDQSSTALKEWLVEAQGIELLDSKKTISDILYQTQCFRTPGIEVPFVSSVGDHYLINSEGFVTKTFQLVVSQESEPYFKTLS